MNLVHTPDSLPSPLCRIAVVGTSGCGKSFFSRELSARTGTTHFEIDALAWDDDWTEVPDDDLRARFDEATEQPRWIVDGNYGRAGIRDVALTRADLVVWLDLPFNTIMRRITARSLKRAVTRERLWGTNNHETFRLLLASRYSMPLWAAQTFRTRRHQYDAFERPEEYRDTALLRIRTPRQTDTWIDEVTRRISSSTNPTP